MVKLCQVLACSLALFIATCLAANGQVRRLEDSIKIGVLTDMNGPLSGATGRGSIEAVRMAVEDFGSVVNGRRIEIVTGDHQNKPDIGSAIARKWFDVDHVDVIVEAANSAVGLAVVEIARPLNKILLIGAASSDFTGTACAPTSIQWTWDTYSASTGIVNAVFNPTSDKWFFITSDFAFGHALEQDGTKAIDRLGGKVVGRTRVPFGTNDFSSFLLQAQQSKASVIALATAGADTVNLMKQAAEFGLTKPGSARVVPMQIMLTEIKAIGSELGQGIHTLFAFHHDRSPEAKSWSSHFFERANAMPTQIQAGDYSAVRHYLQAVKTTGTAEPLTVVATMKATPVDDMFATGGIVRPDGSLVHDMYLVQIKSPPESTGPWDLVRIVKTIPGNQAFRPLSESECPLVRK
jgi:branched-chain amino acid transport system substrate-binding protein